MGNNSKQTASKIRFVVYSALFFFAFVYSAWYTDDVYLNNLKKINYASRDKIQLMDFETILSTIHPDNALKAKLIFINNQSYFHFDGFEDEILLKGNRNLLKRNKLHPSQSLALFSMGFLSDFFLSSLDSNSLSLSVVNNICDIYMLLYSKINNPISLNTIIFNDHVVSERIQFVTLFLSYMEKFHPEKIKLIKALYKDLSICLNFMLDDEHFTWQTNHGIMQLRSMAQMAGVIDNSFLRNKILRNFDKRLTDIIPYFIGMDGAVYESASGYWMYIFSQFEKITNIDAVKNLGSVIELKDKLLQVENFINTVSSNDGFLQGMGDSYSCYINSNLLMSKNNRYFLYSNGLAGATWSQNSLDYNVLFASLYTPPNIHKLPEDLSLYL